MNLRNRESNAHIFIQRVYFNHYSHAKDSFQTNVESNYIIMIKDTFNPLDTVQCFIDETTIYLQGIFIISSSSINSINRFEFQCNHDKRNIRLFYVRNVTIKISITSCKLLVSVKESLYGQVSYNKNLYLFCAG